MMRPWFIYRIKNGVSGKAYIGISTNPDIRFRAHRSCRNGAPLLTNAIKSYGLDAFSFEVFACSRTQEDAHALERQLIISEDTKHPNGYNLSDGGQGAAGFKQSAESVRKRADAIRGHLVSEATRRKISAKLRGVPLSSEELKKYEKEMIERPKPRGLTPEGRLRISLFHRGRKKSLESIQKTKEGRRISIKKRCESDPDFLDMMRKSARNALAVRWNRHRTTKVYQRQLFLMIS